MVEITLEHGMNPKGSMALICFATVLCQTSSNLLDKLDAPCKIGKLGIDMLENQYNPSEVLDVRARSILYYYSLVAPFSVPIQTCTSKLKTGVQTGLSAGDFMSAFMCMIQHVRLSILAGFHLGDLLSGKVANQSARLIFVTFDIGLVSPSKRNQTLPLSFSRA